MAALTHPGHSKGHPDAHASHDAPGILVPFTHAAHEQNEPAFDVTKALTANPQKLGPFDVPARGYARAIWIEVHASGGTLGPGVLAADGPWTALQSVSLNDVNGAPIQHPVDGYQLFLENKWGGYKFHADPESQPDFSAAPVAFSFALRIPIEISESDGLGSLSNQNAAAAYKVFITLAGSGDVYSTLPTALPNVQVLGSLEAWSQPPAVTPDGLPVLDRPPMLGTTQYWSPETYPVVAGPNQFKISKVGEQIRNIIAVYRHVDGTRNDADYPDNMRLVWDNRDQWEETRVYRQRLMAERFRQPTRAAKDVGVYVYDWAHDVLGHPGGMDDGHLWIRTLASTKFQFKGTFAAAGTITFLVNDVAPVEVADRYEEFSATGGQ